MFCPRHEAECDERCGPAGERCRVERPKIECSGTLRLTKLGLDGQPSGPTVEVDVIGPVTITVLPE